MSASRMLRYARRRAGLSQRQLGARAGVPQPAVARIERGRVSVRLDTLERLLAATGMTLRLEPRIGDGVDRSLIRASLARTPQERLEAAARAANNLEAFLAEVTNGPRS